MKKTIKLAVVAALALGATSAFATNGSVLLGMGAKTRGMGGTGIGVSHGAESALSNPALITTVEGTEISFGGTLFMPNVDNTNNLGFGNSAGESKADIFVIPSVSLANKVNDNFYWGMGMWGTGGLGVDYRDTASVLAGGTQMQMTTSLQLMQFGVPLVYTTNNFSIGFTPILQYGALDIGYEYPGNPNPGTPSAGTYFGAGVQDDLAFGYNIGLAYTTSNITIGAVYISEIEMDYSGVMSKTISPFVNPTTNPNGYTNDKLSSPEQYGVGISYSMQGHTLAFDYKIINWEDAEGYKDFEWENQDVIAIGYEYATDKWAVRLGYQYADSAVKEQATNFTAQGDISAPNSAGLNGSTVNTFNALGFPGNVETHITVGASYAVNEKMSVDLAYVRALEADDTFTNFAGQDMTVTHSEDSISFQMNYNF
ncbi:MAG: aromatic hydrocarbon degradation protein [Sulfurimonas sp.]|nr:MAG: aromatic hydrocarbon degradation protein [Sulfurimonas sp.]